MKLRNKKTGEKHDFKITAISDETYNGWKLESDDRTLYYDHIEEIAEEWEEYKEPLYYWYIIHNGRIDYADRDNNWEFEEAIGNKFETKEEAEKALEKLKALKRLKDKGFRFEGWEDDYPIIGKNSIFFNIPEEDWETDVADDLNLLFGGEDE